MHITGLGGAIFLIVLVLAVGLFLYFMSGLFGARELDIRLDEADLDINEDP